MSKLTHQTLDSLWAALQLSRPTAVRAMRKVDYWSRVQVDTYKTQRRLFLALRRQCKNWKRPEVQWNWVLRNQSKTELKGPAQKAEVAKLNDLKTDLRFINPRFSGQCFECGRRYTPGKLIMWRKGEAYHPECAPISDEDKLILAKKAIAAANGTGK